MAEDLVTYQICKKLKEKGFPINGKEIICGDNGVFIPTPTIYQILKWLREDKKISVEKNVGMHPYKRDVCWYCTIVRFSESGVREILDNFGETCNVFDSYEEAVLSGIEYVLDNNLI